MIKHGLQNCIVSNKRVYSDEIMDDVLSGKRVIIYPLSTYKTILSKRTKNKRQCGFYISESEANYEPQFMLFNKKFNKKLKEKIDFTYVRISLLINIFMHSIFFVLQTFRNVRAKTI